MMVLSQSEGSKLEDLKAMEAQAREGIKHVRYGDNLLSIAIHRILTEKLYLAELDDKGLPLYPTQTAYEPHLLAELQISRQTLYNYYTPIKIACGPTFQLDYDEFVSTGGKTSWAVAKEYLEYDDDTGKALTLRDGRPLEVQKLTETLTEINIPGPSELMLRPAQVRSHLEEALGFEKVYQPTMEYYEQLVSHGQSWDLWLYWRLESETGPLINLVGLPFKVMEDLYKNLKVKKQ